VQTERFSLATNTMLDESPQLQSLQQMQVGQTLAFSDEWK